MKNDLFSTQNMPHRMTPKDRPSKLQKREGTLIKIENQSFASVKWPNRLLALIHPFNIDMQVDEMVEKLLGLNLPFLDFRLGV